MPITCSRCGREFKGDRLNARHLAKCFPELRPNVPPCLCGHEATSLTQMKRHRRTCDVWQARDPAAVAKARRKQTSLKRYGVEDSSQTPEAQAKRASTNLERYGAENPFSKEASTFEKVQASLEGKRPVLKGVENPFSRPEVKAKIRQHWQREHGVSNPQQVPKVRERTKQTVLERYGGELLASPSIRAKAEATNLKKYGAAFAGGTPEVQVKVVATNMKKYGVPYTCMDPEVRAKQLATMEANYGSHFFASEEGKAIVREVMLERYGVEFPGAMEGHWGKAVATFRRKFGVDHPLQLPEFVQKREATNMERYGWANFIGTPEFVLAALHSYGVAIPSPLPGHPMKVVEYAFKHIKRMRPIRGPNQLEVTVAGMDTRLMFTGDGAFWWRLPSLGQFKNPDFLVPGPEAAHPFKGVRAAVEVFGDYWHSRMRTGKAKWEHEQELIDAFADTGITCLILWEKDIKHDPKKVALRLKRFVDQFATSGEVS